MSPHVPQVGLDAQGTEGCHLPCPRERQILRTTRGHEKPPSVIGHNGRRQRGQSSDIAAGKVPGVPTLPTAAAPTLVNLGPWTAQRCASVQRGAL